MLACWSEVIIFTLIVIHKPSTVAGQVSCLRRHAGPASLALKAERKTHALEIQKLFQ